MQERTYRIGEAAKLLNLKTYVLRFWETEFSQLHPHRTGKGQRLYSEQDVAMLRTIRHLLHERGLTIEGARKILAEQKDIAMPLDGGETLPPEATASEPSQPLYSEALTEAVISALQRTGQNGLGAAHDDEDEMHLPDIQTIESIVARVIAAGEGVPPEDSVWQVQAHDSRQHAVGSVSSRVANSIRNTQGVLFDKAQQENVSDRRTEIVSESSQISDYQPRPSASDNPSTQQSPRIAAGIHRQPEQQYQSAQQNQLGRAYTAEQADPAEMAESAIRQGTQSEHAVSGAETAPAFVREVIAELESLRDMLSPRRFR